MPEISNTKIPSITSVHFAFTRSVFRFILKTLKNDNSLFKKLKIDRNKWFQFLYFSNVSHHTLSKRFKKKSSPK